MVKITSTTGDVKTGVQGPAVYQGHYGRQIRRMLSPKGAPPSKTQLTHRDLFRLSLAWKKTLTPHDRAWLKWHADEARVIDSFQVPLTWNRYADKIVLSHPQFRLRCLGDPPSLVLEVYHPALLEVILTREGEGEQSWGGLSSLENEYITTEVHIDAQPEDVIQVKTLPGVMYAYTVPGIKEVEMAVSPWEHIETITVESEVGEVNFQNLSTEFTAFRLTIMAKIYFTQPIPLGMRFNDDRATNYDFRLLMAEDTTVSTEAFEDSNYAVIGFFGTTIYGTAFAYIQNLMASDEKGYISHASLGPLAFRHYGGLWKNTTEKITMITLVALLGSIGPGSKFILEGTRQ
ncbi:hypothetical protein ES703_34946 [subsurface metagenome]